MNRPHILFIPSWYPSDDAPLLGTFFKEQAEMFSEVGHKVGVLHARFHDLPSKGWLKGPVHGIEMSEENGLTVVRASARLFQPGPLQRIPPIYRASVNKRKRLAIKMYEAYVVVNGKPDIIHAKCTMWGAVIGTAVAEHAKLPLVVTVGSSVFARGIAGPRERRTAAESLLKAQCLLSVSNPMAIDLGEKIGINSEPFTIVPNMIDVDKFPLCVDSKPRDEFTWGYMANLVNDKGHDTLLQAFSSSIEGRLLLAGDGPLRESLEVLTKDLGIGDRVEFLGAIPRDQAHTFYQMIDAFVHPSRYETFGIVAVESLCSGRPVVATMCGGPNDIVREQDGILVPVDDAQALASAMKMAASMKWDPEEMRKGVVERYSKQNIRSILLGIYDSLL